MDVELTAWQTRLAKHFTELHRRRSSEAPGHPIFALEHGLDISEVHALATAVRAHVAHGPPQRDHALPWIVYAAEIGYRYAGDEYWQTFEQETLGWTVYGDRHWIRERYRSFQEEFGGAKPSGIWAGQFSIICWPITHAILPQDLQRQLARILYEIRHLFSAELMESPSRLGDFIATRSWNATSRFQNFAQETQLVGQIAALLLEGKFGSGSLIYPETLKRIGGDLDSERQAREWLRGARRSAHERAQIRGLTWRRGTTLPAVHRPDEARAEVAALGIEPRLVLRPTNAAGTSWEVLLEIPDLSHLLQRFPQTREILTGARCVVAGAAGPPLARGRCLYGAQRVKLAQWPRADEVLLRFEQKDLQLEYLLRTECLLRPGPTWLFRIASDGLAYELRSLRVRPGERYLIVSAGGTVKSSDHIRPVELACTGVHCVVLDLPPALTTDWEKTLQQLGLGQAKTIEVWPAGLAAAFWDGEGHGEWPASERPCLAIRTDHPIDTFLVSMGVGAETVLELTSVMPGEPVFIELPQLPIGLHTVRVCTRSKLAAQVEPLGDLDVIISIREVRSWSAGVSIHGPLLVHMDPTRPTLEQLWAGQVEVALRGPAGRQVKCRVTLHEKNTDNATVTVRLPPMMLPVTAADWRNYFKKHFQDTHEAQVAYDTARDCELEFTAEELGAFTVCCEREFTPIRWGLRRDGREHIALLVDDSGDSSPPLVTRRAFETPCIEEALEFAYSYAVPTTGGLYVAHRGDFTSAVIIPPVVKSLSDLGCVPRIDGEKRSAESVIHFLSIARLWGRARLSGDLLSAIRQRDILLALTRHIFRILGGERWAKAEGALGNGFIGFGDLERAISRHHEEIQIGEVLWRQHAELATADREERIRALTELAKKFLPLPANAGDFRWFSEFALRLASDPVEVEAWAGPLLCDGLTNLLDGLPTLVRAARYLVLTTDRHLLSSTAIGQLYAGWRWT